MSTKARRATMTVLAIAAALVAASVAGCGGRRAADPRSPPVYLDHALRVIEQNSLYASGVDWRPVRARARKLAAGAKTSRGTYPAIRYAVQQVFKAGDLHATFLDPATTKRYAPGSPGLEAASAPPTVTLLGGRLGLIKLPGISSLPRSPNSRRYASVALTAIRRLDARHRPCGWVVDLRSDAGGDMVPMLLSVGPIAGEGWLIGFAGKRSIRYFVSYRAGALSAPRRYVYRAPVRLPDLAPAPPVAVLTDEGTASAGEVVAVAFRGRAHTRSFGHATAGATNAPHAYHLPDGADCASRPSTTSTETASSISTRWSRTATSTCSERRAILR